MSECVYTTNMPTSKEVLKFIFSFQAKNRYSPTMSDICEHFGFKSTNAAHRHVIKLEKQGDIERSEKGTILFPHSP